ncbi:cyclin-T1-3-like [Nicotiana tabacum]|uniref:Cyclin-T1-3-like n=1 Tax=Nicotiana tabacum TaxID=4097 RepID=A0A1S3ZBX5_TOBAC|nr:cyclin-T1-3-like [Nicotiana tomentosiformis]XP_016461911.1 PREDICTED: cyclin-T1-3-like [Nicotiana tabacum]
MAGQLPENPSYPELARVASSMHIQEKSQSLTQRWYFTKEEIEDHSPSRKDGIDYEKESHLRKLYCSFLQELGIELKVPQVTIATAMMLCHRFYMRQSHAKNHWQIVATVSMFLACKAEETPRWLSDFVVVSYKLVYKWDPSAPLRIRQKDIYDKEKESIVAGERMLLATVAFDLNIEHPYKTLVAAMKRLEISNKEMVKVAWNFVNDWLRTTLCLQYKPHYIAAGSMFLAAKLLKVKLPTGKGNPWWMQFDVAPKQLEEVIQKMLQLLEQNQKQVTPSMSGRSTELKPVAGKAVSSSTESCISSVSVVAQDSRNMELVEARGSSTSVTSKCSEKESCNIVNTVKETESECGSANSAVEDGVCQPIKDDAKKEICQTISAGDHNGNIDIDRIKERLKRRKLEKNSLKKLAKDDEIDSEAWIERELENLG